ncbi:LRR receptor-like serine/threonine-protein kinase EFR-like isoform X1 [Hibiscus syriacus]|uniref:non-specific serine/threonine protein kinase n=1 Tax=Hibiscus syriacus TaxID=106335 RepID=A0A6A2XE52_HIBSY|nr:LRR receptor-like serine/threonine-protein kinase EFR-like isoform X1 [Hibiscus syriacus]
MIDVATALEYLHTGHPTPIIHCDVKPSNILLDDDMVAHVGDFGIAKLLGEGDVMKQTMTLATIGYMAPEFGSARIVSIKCDVYSYGIVLMETFIRKKPTDEFFAEEMTIRHWIKRLLPKGMLDIADVDLLRRDDKYFVVKANCISSIMDLALDCSAELPEERKDMKDVVIELKKIKQRQTYAHTLTSMPPPSSFVPTPFYFPSPYVPAYYPFPGTSPGFPPDAPCFSHGASYSSLTHGSAAYIATVPTPSGSSSSVSAYWR